MWHKGDCHKSGSVNGPRSSQPPRHHHEHQNYLYRNSNHCLSTPAAATSPAAVGSVACGALPHCDAMCRSASW